jgi:hypothetical protein
MRRSSSICCATADRIARASAIDIDVAYDTRGPLRAAGGLVNHAGQGIPVGSSSRRGILECSDPGRE